MKKIYIHMMMLAALVVAGAAMTSCQKEEVATGKFKMSINATMAGGNSKALSIEGSTLNATWAVGEQVTVYKGEAEIGTLTAQSAGESTTLDGTITGTIATNDVLTLKFCSPDKYTSQDGTLEYIAANCDYATATVTVSSVNNGIVTTTNNSMVTFTNQQAIVKFTLKKSDGTALPANPSAFTVNDGTSDVVTLTSIPAATYTNPNNGDGVLYVALPAVSDKPITLTATVGDDTYTYEKSGVTFTNGQYYEITVKMTKQVPAAKPAAEATAEDKGKLIGTDGNIYTDVAAATAAGTTAVAKIIYIGTTGHATYTHGLALALTDEASKMAWQDAIDACSAKNESTTAVTNATWLLASRAQWDYMMGANGAGSHYDLRDGFSGITGASNLQWNYYWSSTEDDSEYAWYYSFAYGVWLHVKKGSNNYVRACLAF